MAKPIITQQASLEETQVFLERRIPQLPEVKTTKDWDACDLRIASPDAVFALPETWFRSDGWERVIQRRALAPVLPPQVAQRETKAHAAATFLTQIDALGGLMGPVGAGPRVLLPPIACVVRRSRDAPLFALDRRP